MAKFVAVLALLLGIAYANPLLDSATDVRAECSGSQLITSASGRLTTDSFFPEPTANPASRTCRLIFNAVPGKVIELTFTQKTDKICAEEYINLYTNSAASAEPVCGVTSTPAAKGPICRQPLSFKQYVTKGTFIVEYCRQQIAVSQYTKTNGLQVAWRTVSAVPKVKEENHLHVMNTPTETGNFSTAPSPLAFLRYATDVIRRYKIVAPESYHVRIWVSHVLESSTSCGADSLKIYEQNQGSSKVLDVLCGNGRKVYTSDSNELFVEFNSDSAISAGGFLVQYRAVAAKCEEDEFLCQGSRKCVKYSKRCDGVRDCDDGFDEIRENCGLTCGQSAVQPTDVHPSVHNRIVGGTFVVPHSWPSQIGIVNRGDNLNSCGGTLINNQWIVTAGHCFAKVDMLEAGLALIDRGKPEDYYFTLGEHNPYDWSDQENVIDGYAERILIHPNFTMMNPFDPMEDLANDIALIKLSKPVHFSKSILPACLPPKGKLPKPGQMCMTIGWGTRFPRPPNPPFPFPEEAAIATRFDPTPDSFPLSFLLKQLEMPIIGHEECYNQMEGTMFASMLRDTMVCAGHEAGIVGVCQGDSGGPLYCRNEANDAYELAGVTSWGDGCAAARKPTMYTGVANYIDWLEETMANN